jgi:hypothetical protein
MWSEIADPITVEGGVTISDIIPMMRMTAKIEVVVSSEAALAAVPFTLTSVRLYNTNRRGRIVPKSNDIYIDNFKAVRPSLPDNINRVRGPIIYSGTAASPGDFSQGEFGVDMPRAIYLFETAAQTDRLEQTVIVVGGTRGTSTTQTFYRIDFMNSDGSGYQDILRNYNYTITILSVSENGYPSADAAFAGESFNNIDATVVGNHQYNPPERYACFCIQQQ